MNPTPGLDPSADLSTSIKTAPELPGVYRYRNRDNEILYIGKAKNLRARLTSYLSKTLDKKTAQLMLQATQVEYFITHHETEALILENQQIKQHQPKFNILLKDEKSYPYLCFSKDPFPRLTIQRQRGTQHELFGPYASSQQVTDMLTLLQKVFKIRNCSNHFFAQRSRPCMQYQIKRCTAPCVQKVTESTYREQVQQAKKLLRGKNTELIKQWQQAMSERVEALDFEQAAHYRDNIRLIQKLQTEQLVENPVKQLDVIAFSRSANSICFHYVAYRQGKMQFNQCFYYDHHDLSTTQALLSTFFMQLYLHSKSVVLPLKQIIVSELPKDASTIETILSDHYRQTIKITLPTRGIKQDLMTLASKNAEHALAQYLEQVGHQKQLHTLLQQHFNIAHTPETIECFDISHFQGEATYASCMVFKDGQAQRAAHRAYKIEHEHNDDYQSMREVIERRYARHQPPDVILIDGGKGQLNVFREFFKAYTNPPYLIAVSKGENRLAGREIFWHGDAEEAPALGLQSPLMRYLLHIRDEAHRFAIKHHRKKMRQNIQTEVLPIPGVGKAKQKALILFFGSLSAVKEARLQELLKVPGIGPELARKIWHHTHHE